MCQLPSVKERDTFVSAGSANYELTERTSRCTGVLHASHARVGWCNTTAPAVWRGGRCRCRCPLHTRTIFKSRARFDRISSKHVSGRFTEVLGGRLDGCPPKAPFSNSPKIRIPGKHTHNVRDAAVQRAPRGDSPPYTSLAQAPLSQSSRSPTPAHTNTGTGKNSKQNITGTMSGGATIDELKDVLRETLENRGALGGASYRVPLFTSTASRYSCINCCCSCGSVFHEPLNPRKLSPLGPKMC